MNKKPPVKDGTFGEDEVLGLARRAYQHGRASFEIDPKKCALMVIDMQEPELKVLRKGFARVMTADEIIKALT